MVAHYVDKKCKGICCDLCNAVVVDAFVYYSVKFTKVGVDVSRGKVNPSPDGQDGLTSVEHKYLDLDICEACYEKIRKNVLSKIEEREKSKKGKGQWTTKT